MHRTAAIKQINKVFMQMAAWKSWGARLQRLAAGATLGLAAQALAWAQNPLDPSLAPNDFVQTITDQALKAIEANNAIRAGDAQAIQQTVDQYILPYINMEKTTRLAAGRYWRQASGTQRQQLIEGFTRTLIRTYSSALAQIAPNTKITLLPWRNEPDASDTVVRSSIERTGGAPVAVDYRLEKTPQGWKIYDLNVEGIWLIQNYRNQFAQEISVRGIDGLIAALNRRSP